MRTIPNIVKRVIEHFDALPGIGGKNAARLAYHVLERREYAANFARDLEQALAVIRLCDECQTLTDKEKCGVCSDAQRDHTTICVIAHIQDLEPIEHTGKFNGLYHVLHGTINPIEGVTPDAIRIKELISRIERNGIREIILALDATMDGEATTLYLTKLLKEKGLQLSVLARGMPLGSNIEYTDEGTLSSALENRKKIQ